VIGERVSNHVRGRRAPDELVELAKRSATLA
jgi:hypothetical protein